MMIRSIRGWHVHYYLDLDRNLITLFPFDMCRWQVKDEDVGDVHGVIVIFYQQAFTEALSSARIRVRLIARGQAL